MPVSARYCTTSRPRSCTATTVSGSAACRSPRAGGPSTAGSRSACAINMQLLDQLDESAPRVGDPFSTVELFG
ncbi:hypothetical protein [Herbihabitans rhizosphaerae]|uniref:hypothetical protein n=1 Tax=Herbihabitans rhizosphaerae TaxID=1872711 RepID=UPI00102B27DA|nr:hypothetical protein [Herbihabitans rhizosphaerae]